MKYILLILLSLQCHLIRANETKFITPLSVTHGSYPCVNIGANYLYMGTKIKYITGQQVGNCIFICDIASIKRKARFQCKCGNLFITFIHLVKNFHTQSCGCLTITHGQSKSSEYNTWCLMRKRCANPSSPDYKYYGERGIVVCERWLSSYQNFIEDMGQKPSAKHSIERNDVNGNYEPFNCRWATPTEQARNKTNNKIISFNGETKCLQEWANSINIKIATLHNRISRGWSIEKALTTPLLI